VARLNGALVQVRQDAATAVLRVDGAEALAIAERVVSPTERAPDVTAAEASAVALESVSAKKPATRRRG
jgi:hypothetical protein